MIAVTRACGATVGRMVRWQVRCTLTVAALATLACSDATAPNDRTLQVIVADTVRPGDMQITIRNATGSVVHLDWCNVTLEQQLPSGGWPDPTPPQLLCVGQDLAPGYEATATRNAPPTGRYRYVYPYYLGTSSDYVRAYSNTFVAVP
jgi:hypothetical protein